MWRQLVDASLAKQIQALMQQFKESVLGEDGLSLRAMSDESAKELADQAATGLLDLVDREFHSRISRASGGSSADHATAAHTGHPATDGRKRSVVSPFSTAPERDRDEEEDSEEEGGLDWLDGIKRQAAGARSRPGGAGGVKRTGSTLLGDDATAQPLPVLESIGDRAEYESALVALKAYHRQHGNLLLTQNYVMPDEEDNGNMLEHRGWRLGQKVYTMKFWKRHVRDRPSRRAELAKLGFVWGRLQDEYNLFLEALLAYRDIEGCLLVPTSFVVPETEPWPLSCQGMRLGAKVAGVRNQSLYVRTDVARWYQLDAIGFVWDLSDAPFRQVYDALLQYKAEHGNLHVPVAFSVPSSPPWHQDLWGLALGQRVLDIRATHRYIRNDPERIRLLNEVGFRWTDATKASYGNVVRALKAYRKIKGRDLSVPSSFVVPSFLPWPQSCWGLRLGTALVDIRSKGRYLKGEERQQRRMELERLGVFAQSREAILANVVKGLRTYLSVFGNTMVPQGFVVPDGEAWPEECRKQKLGSMLYGLRRNPERLNRHPEIRAEITALGFSWKVPKRGRRKSTATAAAAAAAATCAGVDGTVPRSRGGGRNEAQRGEPGGAAAAAAAVLRPPPPPSDAAVVVLAAEGVGQDIERPSRLGDGAGGRGFDVGVGDGGTVVSDGRSEGVRARNRADGEDNTAGKTNKGSVVANSSASRRNRAGRLLSPAGC
ncbi:conserved unknown protein [Ectocarpus siliculosus]|uniref:Helicase-associated domain-containing protein n=1 Tax=Ectocarpus siliculosus TaxID=2880 RepID=D7G5K9_ECTSI|nr:conserved unknown protein [Ectocarpus siliculosus]|eukprot:CBJ27332.1 conserved unknown protein [Ectocarpus siliculosus]